MMKVSDKLHLTKEAPSITITETYGNNRCDLESVFSHRPYN
jgi:hypothetical protein